MIHSVHLSVPSLLESSPEAYLVERVTDVNLHDQHRHRREHGKAQRRVDVDVGERGPWQHAVQGAGRVGCGRGITLLNTVMMYICKQTNKYICKYIYVCVYEYIHISHIFPFILASISLPTVSFLLFLKSGRTLFHYFFTLENMHINQ